MAYVGALPNPAGAAGPGDITLPAPWASRDIGAVGAAGTASHSSGVFTVRGSGANISGGSDAFHYAFRPMSGDGYAAFRADLDAGGRIDSRIKWVKYNPEKWDLTPLNEQENPGYYMQVFCQAAHANGYKCITAPARSLLLVTSAVCHIDYSIDDNLNDAYLRCRTAEQAAMYSDQFGIQGQVNQGDPTKYRDFVSRASAQAKAANSNVQVIANLTTNLQDVNQSSCTLYNASTASRTSWRVIGSTSTVALGLSPSTS